MSKYPDEFETDRLLQQGLRSLPVPEASTDFDARIHAALERPVPWWRPVWTSARPVLAAAACSLVVTLALLQGFAGNPASAPPAPQIATADARVADAHITERERAYIEVLDRGIDRIDLSNGSWRLFTMLWWPLAVKTMSKPPHVSMPDHHS